ncbi:MAG: EF-P beta-lysylation protein EpmB [Halioglobus sp.]
MIPHTDLQWQALTWQQELKEAIRCPIELLSFLDLEPDQAESRALASRDFPMLVPRPFASKMKRGDRRDPLLLQVLPSPEELCNPAGYTRDPLQESLKNPVPGLIHKYHGRVLLIAAPGCAVNCRYCFRRHFEYSANSPSQSHWPQTLDYIAADSSISEVILSGGDPLLLNDSLLEEFIERISAISHVRRLRIHTRLPVVLPARLTLQLSNILGQSRLQCVMVIHCNHANEIDENLASSLKKFAASGVTLLNQSVLLRGINDSAEVLATLSETLFDARVMPYYLHLLDHVSGAAHFDLPQSRALEIYEELLAKCSGYLVPRLVRECPSTASKIPLTPYT